MIRLGIAAPHRPRCGIADYARFLRAEMEAHFEIVSVDLPETDSRSSWLRAAAAASRADLVHVHYEYSLFRTVKPYRNRFATFMRRLGTTSVVSLHDLLPTLEPRGWPRSPRDLLRDLAYAPWFSRWERDLYSLADHWLVHTEEHRRAVARAAGERSVSRFLHPVPETGVEWSRPTAPVALITPGFVKPHKGYLRFVDVLRRLPGASWTIAGGPQDERDRRFMRHLEDRIRASGTSERITVTGYLPRIEIERLASRSRAAVFPFERATGSGSVTWAIGLGMPIVATDLPALRELADGGAGLELLPLDAVEEWPERIGALLDSLARLDTLAAANAAFAREHRFADLARQLASLFRNLSSSDRDRPRA